MSPNKRTSLRTRKRLTVPSKAKAESTLTRSTCSTRSTRRKVPKSEEKSEVMAGKNASKELRVNLVRLKFDEVPERSDVNSVEEEEGEKDLAPPPVNGGVVKEAEERMEVEECHVDSEKFRMRRLCVNLQCFVGDPVETPEKETESCAVPERVDKSTETSTTDNRDFNILEVIKKYLPSNDDNNYSNMEHKTKLHNGNGGGDDVLYLSSDCDEAEEITQPSSSAVLDEDVLITDCYDSSSDPATCATFRDFLDDAAEEGEPDDESSDPDCEIPVRDETICLSESESEPDDYDRSDPFICDDEEDEQVETEKSGKIIIHENINVSEIKDKSLQKTVKEVIHSLVVGKKGGRNENNGAKNKEINHWEVDSAHAIWYVEKMHIRPSDH